MKTAKVAVIQATPIIFNLEATIEKTVHLIEDAAKKEASLIVFPESFIPGYPRGMTFGAVVGRRNEQGRKLYQKYWDNSIEEHDIYFRKIAETAEKNRVYLAIGATERDHLNSSLYCTYFYFAPDGTYLGKHKKIKPTGTERIIWAEGDGDTLTVIDSDLGRFGGLICWENYMPLARYAIYSKGVEIFLAPTADARDEWQHTMQHIALESRSFVIGCNQYITKNDYPDFMLNETENTEDLECRGGSVVISPLGKVISGPVFGEEKIIVAELDLDEIVRAKMDFDVIGHYSRNDIFSFQARGLPEIVKHRSQ